MGWVHLKTDSKSGITVMQLAGKHRASCFRAEGSLNCAPAALLALLLDNDRIPEYNEFYKSFRSLEVPAPCTGGMMRELCLCQYNAVWPTKARDFVMMTLADRVPAAGSPVPERLVVASVSVEHPDAPPHDAFVRGTVICGGYVLHSVPGDPNSCKVTMITQSDPGGNLPMSLVNKLSQTAPIKLLKAIRKCVEPGGRKKKK